MPITNFDLLNLEFECDPATEELSSDVRNAISQVLDGSAFQNPIGSLIDGSKELLNANNELSRGIQDGIGDLLGGVGGSSGLQDASDALSGLQSIMGDPNTPTPFDPDNPNLNSALNFAQDYTNRLSGKLIDNEATLYSFNNAVGLAGAQNIIANNLRLPEQDLIDNFFGGFESILEDGGGQLFASVQALNGNITGILGQYADVADWGQDINKINDFVNQITDITGTITGSITNIQNLVNSGKQFFDNALSLVQRYGAWQLIASSLLNDPCFSGEVVRRVTDFGKDLENAIFPPSPKSLAGTGLEITPSVTYDPIKIGNVTLEGIGPRNLDYDFIGGLATLTPGPPLVGPLPPLVGPLPQ